MNAPKKAAKKTAKKAAKTAKHHGKHHGKDHHAGKDIRRMYEHLGRLSALEEALSSEVVEQIERLTELAQHTLQAGEPKSAADILRACEHLSFGSLARSVRASSLSDDLEAAIEAEYEHLIDKAETHWKKNEGRRPVEIEAVHEEMLAEAEAAFATWAFRRALEYARGAEALAHVHGDTGIIKEIARIGDEDGAGPKRPPGARPKPPLGARRVKKAKPEGRVNKSASAGVGGHADY